MVTRKVIAAGIAVAGVSIAGYAVYLWIKRPPAPPPPPPPTKVETRMVVTTPPPSSVIAGEEFPFEGYLEDADGHRLMDKEYQIFIDGMGQTKNRTTADGYWGYVISFGTPGAHEMYVKFAGDVTYEGCEVVARERKSF